MQLWRGWPGQAGSDCLPLRNPPLWECRTSPPELLRPRLGGQITELSGLSNSVRHYCGDYLIALGYTPWLALFQGDEQLGLLLVVNAEQVGQQLLTPYTKRLAQ